MGNKRFKFMLELADPDVQLLRCLAAEGGHTQSAILRWALRFYALKGPWNVRGQQQRREVLSPFGMLNCGPHWEELDP